MQTILPPPAKPATRRILITGGSGLIGRRLLSRLRQRQYQLTVLTRNMQKTRQRIGEHLSADNPVQLWSTLADKTTLDGFDAVINLAGAPIAGKRWTAAGKRLLCHSRWQITQRLVQLINASQQPPAVLLSGSAIGYYGDQADQPVNEQSPPHNEFTHQLCQRWEQLALAASPRTRVCLLRTGVVLATEGGMLATLLPLFRLGLGGRISHGQQYVSWIHIDDMVSALLWLLDQPLSGAFNLTAPHPVTNAEFTRRLARALHRPAPLPVAGWIMRCIMGEAAALLLASQRVLPAQLLESGFQFHWQQLDNALTDLLQHKTA